MEFPFLIQSITESGKTPRPCLLNTDDDDETRVNPQPQLAGRRCVTKARVKVRPFYVKEDKQTRRGGRGRGKTAPIGRRLG